MFLACISMSMAIQGAEFKCAKGWPCASKTSNLPQELHVGSSVALDGTSAEGANGAIIQWLKSSLTDEVSFGTFSVNDSMKNSPPDKSVHVQLDQTWTILIRQHLPCTTSLPQFQEALLAAHAPCTVHYEIWEYC